MSQPLAQVTSTLAASIRNRQMVGGRARPGGSPRPAPTQRDDDLDGAIGDSGIRCHPIGAGCSDRNGIGLALMPSSLTSN